VADKLRSAPGSVTYVSPRVRFRSEVRVSHVLRPRLYALDRVSMANLAGLARLNLLALPPLLLLYPDDHTRTISLPYYLTTSQLHLPQNILGWPENALQYYRLRTTSAYTSPTCHHCYCYLRGVIFLPLNVPYHKPYFLRSRTFPCRHTLPVPTFLRQTAVQSTITRLRSVAVANTP